MIYLRIILILQISTALISCSDNRGIKRTKIGSTYVEAHFIDSTSIDGIARYYDSSGVLNGVTNFRDGIKEGISINYYPNGKVSDSVEYRSGKEFGYWKEYDEKGNITCGNYYYYGVQFGPELVFENSRLKKFLFSDLNRSKIVECNYSSPGIIDTGILFRPQFNIKSVRFQGKLVFNLFGYLPAIPHTEQRYSIGLSNEAHQDRELTPITGHDFMIDTLLAPPPSGWHYYIGCRLKANKDSIDKFYIQEIVH